MGKVLRTYEMRMKAAVLTFIALLLCLMVLAANTTVGLADDSAEPDEYAATQVCCENTAE